MQWGSGEGSVFNSFKQGENRWIIEGKNWKNLYKPFKFIKALSCLGLFTNRCTGCNSVLACSFTPDEATNWWMTSWTCPLWCQNVPKTAQRADSTYQTGSNRFKLDQTEQKLTQHTTPIAKCRVSILWRQFSIDRQTSLVKKRSFLKYHEYTTPEHRQHTTETPPRHEQNTQNITEHCQDTTDTPSKGHQDTNDHRNTIERPPRNQQDRHQQNTSS